MGLLAAEFITENTQVPGGYNAALEGLVEVLEFQVDMNRMCFLPYRGQRRRLMRRTSS